MVHVGLLPNHDRWGDVLANLRYVVVDEAHVYRGVFGSHVANVLRRLRRLARIYGSEPQFLLASATVVEPRASSAPRSSASRVTVVGDDAAPRTERTVVLWNPPLLDSRARLARVCARRGGAPAGDVRRAWTANADVHEEPQGNGARPPLHRRAARRRHACSRPTARATPPQQRREIERRLKDGELLGVTATNALELGIDVGLLDCVISVGFPGTVASLRQQWGRAGRRGNGVAVLVASEDGLDQYFMREPETLLGRRVEAAILDHANPRVLAGHYEAPLRRRR